MQQPTSVTGASDPRAAAPASFVCASPARFALLLGALIFAAFPQVLLGLETFIVRDYGFFAYPLAHYQRECFWRGELPLWNPYNNCGIPFLAQWNTMPLYPPALIYLVFPLNWSLSFFCLLHLFWAGLGMYFLAHRWSGSRLGAAVAGLAFAFNGFTLNLLMWPSHIATLSWMPWLILLVEAGWHRGGRRLILAAFAGALQMLAGGPETILFTWVILLVLWVTELWRGWREKTPAGAAVLRFPIAVILVAGLAAAQLLPFLDLAAHSQREQGFADARWSMPSWGWANYFVPMVFGHVWSKGLFFQHDQAWTSSYYLGIAPLLLAMLAAWKVRETRVLLLGIMAGAAFVLALGDQILLGRWLRQLIPQLSLMTYPVKYLTVVTLAVPLLAAFGLARLNQATKAKSRLLFLGSIFIVLIATILAWAWRSPFATDDFSNELTNGLSRMGFVVFTVLVLIALVSIGKADLTGAGFLTPGRTRMLGVCLPLGLLLIQWLDVWTHEPSQNPAVPGFVYTPGLAREKLAMNPQPELGQSRAMITSAADTRFRQFPLSDFKDNYLVKRIGYFADCNVLDDVPKVDGFFSLYPRECGELMSALYTTTNAAPPHLLDFLSVSQVTAPGKYFEWQPRNTFLPLATAGQKPVFLDDTNALFAWFNPDFDPTRFVVLQPELKNVIAITNQTRAQILNSKFKSQKSKMIVDLDVQAGEPSLVVLSQTYYHFWQAYVDGIPSKLLRANYAFQAVQIPAGTHHVQLAYEDRALQLGAVISGLTLLACAGTWLRARRATA